MSSLPTSNEYARWLPREMITDESAPASAKADVFMFGMTALEVSFYITSAMFVRWIYLVCMWKIMTGKKPWAEIKNAMLLLTKRGEDCNLLPQRPVAEGVDVIDDNLWELLQRCWALDPEDRPTMLEVLRELEAPRKWDMSCVPDYYY